MTTNAQKTPFVKSLNTFTTGAIQNAAQLLGKSMPCSVVSVDASGTIVTIKLEVQSTYTLPQITCPVYGPQYVRMPLQKGDLGVAFSADLYLGGVSGLGPGTAQMIRQPNLSALVFFPIGNKKFDATDNANQYVLYGPDGVLLRTQDGTTSMELSKKKGGVMVDAPLGGNIFGANLVEASNDLDAKAKGIPQYGFYHKSDGSVWMRLLP